jgi:transposase
LKETKLMSLRAEPVPPIPAQTARVARAAFSEGTVQTRLRDELDVLYGDQDFQGLFAVVGRPAVAPWRLAMVLVMQVMEGLSDRQAAQAVRTRIDWKYALSLELEDGGFDYSVLSEFRDRVLGGGMEQHLLEVLLGRAKAKGLLKAGGRQRTDATHVLAQVRVLNRLERVAETLRAGLEALAVAAPGWLGGWLPEQWCERYERRVEQARLPRDGGQRAALAAQVGADGMRLLEAVWAPGAPGWLRQVPAVEVLRQVWVQHYQVVEGQVRLRPAEQLPPASLLVDSPYDPQARYGKKREVEWVGYKRHLTETCQPTLPHLVTAVQTTPAPVPDLAMTPKVHQQLAARRLLPDTHLVDSAYVDAAGLVAAQAAHGVGLHGPVSADTSWQARAGQGFDLGSFGIDWAAEQAVCPQGKPSAQWVPHHDRDGRAWIHVAFASADCQGCPTRALCTRSASKPRQLSLQPQPLQQALQQARLAQQTPAWRKEYAHRAGVEGTISQAVRSFGLRRCRWRGLAKAHLESVLIAVATNLARLDAWLLGRPLARTRTSHLARLRLASAPTAA